MSAPARTENARTMHATLGMSAPAPATDAGAAYYRDKVEVLRDLFGTAAVSLERGGLVVRGHRYPIIDDVIILLDPSEYPKGLAERIGRRAAAGRAGRASFAEDIQSTFGEEWTAFPEILPEYEQEFRRYFDLVDLAGLADRRVCDLGCGIGRWSVFLWRRCRELVLLDFSDAIFVARRNLSPAGNALFFLGDLTRLPFRRDFADFIVCLGVLHHLSTPALEQVKGLRWWAPRLLVYLYYALDNRPCYFRLLLTVVTGARWVLRTVARGAGVRAVLAALLAAGLYLPLIALGRATSALGWERYVPLSETYAGGSYRRICQDVYDRFFTRIEQRYSRREILGLTGVFSRVTVSERNPYWHFVCER